MFKVVCLFAIYSAATFALDKKAELSYGNIFKGREISAVSIESAKEKTEITWNESVNAEENPLKASLYIEFAKKNQSEFIYLSNLCGTYKKSSTRRSAQIFILKTIANATTCPIKNGTKIIHTNGPKTFSYTIEKNRHCGQLQAEMKIYREKDRTIPAILGYFKGNLTGC